MNRRDFLKAIGLLVPGVAAAKAIAPRKESVDWNLTSQGGHWRIVDDYGVAIEDWGGEYGCFGEIRWFTECRHRVANDGEIHPLSIRSER